jgi:hypothetical protein
VLVINLPFGDGLLVLHNNGIAATTEQVRSLVEHIRINDSRKKDVSEIQRRMTELMRPIEQQILMCDDREDQLMMACAMLQRTRELFDLHIGEDGRKTMFKDLI